MLIPLDLTWLSYKQISQYWRKAMRSKIILLLAGALAVLGLSFGTAGASSNGLPSLTGCFGHHGVQLGTHIAYECIDQSVPGGALYWSANESNFNWDKHPSDGLLWVEASTLHPTPDANPPNTKQAFWVGIGHQGAFCTVINPGYGEHPTQCEINGVVQTMSNRQQASYDEFAAAMTSANLPDCAWSQTIVSDQCDIDN